MTPPADVESRFRRAIAEPEPRAPVAFRRVAGLWLAVAALTGWSATACAETIAPLSGNVWGMWDFSWTIVVGCLAVLVVYFRGFAHRRRRGESVSRWRAFSFSLGVILTYVVLQTPFDALSDHVFWVHRVQHVALHHWIPMLLVLAAPIPELLRGLPSPARRRVLRPILRNRGVRGVYGFIQHPVIAPVLFVGLIYFWLTPSLFQFATVNENLHEVMHFSMLLDGIPFWWLMLDPKPGRLSYGKRLIILWLIMLPQIAVGAYVSFTGRVLYPIYAVLDHGWVSSYMRDQLLGGLIIWIPASMMSAVAGLIVLRFWIRWEARRKRFVDRTRPSGVPSAAASMG